MEIKVWKDSESKKREINMKKLIEVLFEVIVKGGRFTE